MNTEYKLNRWKEDMAGTYNHELRQNMRIYGSTGPVVTKEDIKNAIKRIKINIAAAYSINKTLIFLCI